MRVGLQFVEDWPSLDVNRLHRSGAFQTQRVSIDTGLGRPIRIEWTPCRFGGRRPWFLCPDCGRRAAKLYLVGGTYACRQCHGLVYRSQYSDEIARAISRAQRIRRQLKASTNLTVPVSRPKRMHRTTFLRLRRRAEEAECLVWQLFGLRLRRLDRLRGALERRIKRTVNKCHHEVVGMGTEIGCQPQATRQRNPSLVL